MLTVVQVAERLGVSQTSVYQLARTGAIRHCRIGPQNGRIRFPEDAIDQYLDGCTVTTENAPGRSLLGDVRTVARRQKGLPPRPDGKPYVYDGWGKM